MALITNRPMNPYPIEVAMRASKLAKFTLKVLDTQNQYYAEKNSARKAQLLRQCKGMERSLREDCKRAIEEDQTPDLFQEGMPPDALPVHEAAAESPTGSDGPADDLPDF
jgi:hypothetical protein